MTIIDRFYTVSVANITGLRHYRGRISFLPVGEYHPREVSSSMKHSKSEMLPQRKASDGEIKKSQSLDISGAAGAQLRVDTSVEPGFEKVSLGDDVKEKSSNAINETDDNVNETGDTINGSESTATKNDKSPPVNSSSGDSLTPLLPGLNEPVPSGWVTIEDDFVLVLAMYQTHLNSELIPTPKCKFDDGMIHLLIVRSSITRARILRIMLAFQDGKEMNDDAAETVCVKAFRLEPLTERGILAVDGESVKYGPIQAQVLPSLSQVMALKKSDV